jgi:hypothetical protein
MTTKKRVKVGGYDIVEVALFMGEQVDLINVKYQRYTNLVFPMRL